MGITEGPPHQGSSVHLAGSPKTFLTSPSCGVCRIWGQGNCGAQGSVYGRGVRRKARRPDVATKSNLSGPRCNGLPQHDNWTLSYLEINNTLCTYSLPPFVANDFRRENKVFISGLLNDVTSCVMVPSSSLLPVPPLPELLLQLAGVQAADWRHWADPAANIGSMALALMWGCRLAAHE